MTAERTQTFQPPFDAIRLPAEDEAFIHVCWMLHNQCNHRCSYCDKINWGGSLKWLNLPLVKSFVERALRHYDGRKMMISFTGGEPTLWPEFGEFVEWLASKNVLIGMTTNGTKRGLFFQTYSHFFDWINFSYHPEFTKTNRFLENVAEASKATRVCVRVMMPPEPQLWKTSEIFLTETEKWDQEKKFSSHVRCERVPIALRFGSAYAQPASYTAEQQAIIAAPAPLMKSVGDDFLSKNPLNRVGKSSLSEPDVVSAFDAGDLIAQNQTDFRGWTCDIGLEQIFVDHNGVITRAGCRVGGNIGHIAESTIKFPTAAIRCIKTHCHCVTDILTSKRSKEWEAHSGQPTLNLTDNLNFELDVLKYKLIGKIGEWKTQEFNVQDVRTPTTNIMLNRDERFRARAYTILGWITFLLGRIIAVIGAIQAAIVQTIWCRPVRKSFYFLRYQFYKRVLRKEAQLLDKWSIHHRPRR